METQIVAAVFKPQQPTQTRTLASAFTRVQAEVFAPMMNELVAMESTLTGDDLAAVREFKAAAEKLFATATARVQALR